MSADNCDYCDEDMNFGYVLLLEKHVNKYERIFDESERNLNRYKPVDNELNTISDNNDNNHTTDDVVNKPCEESSINDKNIYTNQYKIRISVQLQFVRSKPTRVRVTIYACKWDNCAFVTEKYASIIKHLLTKHINAKVCRNYRRCFVQLNQYLYKCAQKGCDYETSFEHNIAEHVNTDHRQWKCAAVKCAKCFATKDELSLHEKQHLCGFKLNDSEYLNGNGVCSLANISEYFKKRRCIDGTNRDKLWYRYLCLWSECSFRTYQYKAIQQHIHNSHTCPLINSDLALKGDDKPATAKRKYKKRKKV